MASHGARRAFVPVHAGPRRRRRRRRGTQPTLRASSAALLRQTSPPLRRCVPFRPSPFLPIPSTAARDVSSCCSHDVPGVPVPGAAAVVPGVHAGVPAEAAAAGPAAARPRGVAAAHVQVALGQHLQVGASLPGRRPLVFDVTTLGRLFCRAPLGLRRETPSTAEYSRPPSYRSRTSSTRPTLDPGGGVATPLDHSREASLSESTADSGKVRLVFDAGAKDANLVTIVQTEDSPVIVTVSGSTPIVAGSSVGVSGEMEILAHL